MEAKRFDNGLIITAANPFHWGHLRLVTLGLSFAKEVVIGIGSKVHPYSMPRNIRMISVIETIRASGLAAKVKVIAPEKVTGIDSRLFSVLITGSDLLNKMSSTNHRGAIIHTNFSLSFSNIVCVERKGDELKNELRKRIIRSGINLIEKPVLSLISSNLIRARIKDGKTYRHLIHPETLKYFSQYISTLAL